MDWEWEGISIWDRTADEDSARLELQMSLISMFDP